MSRLRNALLALYVALCALALTWPGYAIFGNSIEPYVFGLPFSLVWNVIWILMTCLVLLTYYLTGRRAS